LRELAIDMGVGQIVQFLGDRSDMPRLLAGLDVFTWLSRGEGMPHVISEAGAARVAVIATRDNGSEEQITPDETGVFVPHEDPPAIASAVLSLLRDPAKRRRLGEALR
jgi:glycosyltransferase involved in cell wall biosynthesis